MAEKQWPTFSVVYNMDGSQWSIDVIARDADDAKRRIAAAASWGTVEGPILMRVPLLAGGFLVPVVVWFRNLFVK